jgi:hypothetical protein
MASISGDAWVKLLLPPGEDGKHEHHGFKWSAPGLNVDDKEWSDKECTGGLHLTLRSEIGRHVRLHDYTMTHIAPVLEIPEGAQVINYALQKKRKVSSVVLGEPVLIADVLREVDDNDAKFKNIFLLWSAAGGHLDLVNHFIELGASAKEGSAIRKAAFWGHVDVVKCLVGFGADGKDAWVFRDAVSGGHLDVINCLLELGANPKNFWALRMAARNGRLHIVKLLVELGAYPTDPVVLADAAENGHLAVVDFLCKLGADPTSALNEAASAGHLDVFNLLVKFGADPTTSDVLYWAEEGGHTNIKNRVVELMAASSAAPEPRYNLRKRSRVE